MGLEALVADAIRLEYGAGYLRELRPGPTCGEDDVAERPPGRLTVLRFDLLAWWARMRYADWTDEDYDRSGIEKRGSRSRT